MNRDLSLSILNQGLISGFNLALNLTLMALATPKEFGLFVILFSSMLIVQAMQHALLTHPLNFLIPGRDAETQARYFAMLADVNRPIIGLSLVIAGLAAWMYATSLPMALATAFYLSTSTARLFLRDVFIVRGQIGRALAQDLVFVLSGIVFIALLWQVTDPVTAAITGLGLATLVSMIAHPASIPRLRGQFRKHVRDYRGVWIYSRWALLSAVQIETQMRGYIFITEAWKGAATLGMLQVGRMLLAPLLLLTAAWSRIARPRMVAQFHNERPREAYATLAGGVLIILAMSVVYGAVIAASWPFIEHYIFRERYDDMGRMAAMWWLYTTLAALNGCGATLLEAKQEYRSLAIVEMVAAAVCLSTLLVISMTTLSVAAVIITLVVVQSLYAIGIVWLILRGRSGRFAAPTNAMSRSGISI